MDIGYTCVNCCAKGYDRQLIAKVRQAKFQKTPLETAASLDPAFDDDVCKGAIDEPVIDHSKAVAEAAV